MGPGLLARIQDESQPIQLRGRFPLLLKFLDANQSLSVQVHPDDAMAATLTPPDLGKTEAWYVLHAEPGSKIFAGLKAGVTRHQFAVAISGGSVEELLHSFEAQSGDCVFVRAGTLHAIGAGLLIVEIQQASDTTFRVFDWNRVDANGVARELHIEQSLQAIDFDMGPVDPLRTAATDIENCKVIVSCEKFSVRKWQLRQAISFSGDQLRLMTVVNGSVAVSGMPGGHHLSAGSTFLIPFAIRNTEIVPHRDSELLEFTIPMEA